jgi:outer membrane protein assembly factor BamB
VVTASPAVVNGTVFVGTEDGHLIIYGLADGKERRRVRLKGRIPIPPLPHDDLLLVAAEGGMLYAFERDTLEPRWTWPIEGQITSPIAVYGEWAYLIEGGGRLCRFNLATGKKDPRSFAADCKLGGPLVREDGVYLGGADGQFYVLSRRSLERRWSFNLGSPVHASVIEWNNVVIVTTIDGTVFGFPPESER